MIKCIVNLPWATLDVHTAVVYVHVHIDLFI